MWIFTDIADAFDKRELEAQDFVADKASKPGTSGEIRFLWAMLSAMMYIGKTVVNVARLGDGVAKEKSLLGVYHDLDRLLLVCSVGQVVKTGKLLGRTIAPRVIGQRIANQALRITAIREFARNVHLVIHGNRVYGRLADVLRLTGQNAGLVRSQLLGKVDSIRSLLLKHGRLSISRVTGLTLKNIEQHIPKNGALFTSIKVSTANHTFSRGVLVFRDFRNRLAIKGDHGIYRSFDAYLKSAKECGAGAISATVKYAEVARDVKFNYSYGQTVLDIFVAVEGLILSNEQLFQRTLESLKDVDIYAIGND